MIRRSGRVSRRSFLRAVVGAGAVTGSMALVGCGPLIRAATESGCTDGDSGQGADPMNNGRGCEGRERTGITDQDVGNNSDAIGYGRGNSARGSNTGNTSGTRSNGVAKPAERATPRRSGLTDSDAGPEADLAGQGRTGRRGYNGVTDSDSGAGADRAGNGRSGGWGNQN